MNDATWLADLLAHGLIHSSFVPPASIQALRELTRTREQLVGEIDRHTVRIQETLEDANLKLTHVVSDVLGTSGLAILNALIAGGTDPERWASASATGGLAPTLTGELRNLTAHVKFRSCRFQRGCVAMAKMRQLSYQLA